MPPHLDVVTLGEALALLRAVDAGPLDAVHRFERSTAGAETNVAVGLARLGLRVGWASRLGDDALGRHLRRTFEAAGVDCSHVETVAGARTGLMFKGRVDDGGDPPIEYHRAGSAAATLDADDLDLPWLARARHLHVTGIFPALSAATWRATLAAIAAVRGAGGSVAFDPNLRPTLWPDPATMRARLNRLAAQADWVLVGLDEGHTLSGATAPRDVAAAFRALGASTVVIKLGADGAWFDDADEGCGAVPAWPVARVVDTVGAGDAFAVGFTSARLEGRGMRDAVRRGAWCGARAVQVPGDTEGLPTRTELDAHEAACGAVHDAPARAPRRAAAPSAFEPSTGDPR